MSKKTREKSAPKRTGGKSGPKSTAVATKPKAAPAKPRAATTSTATRVPSKAGGVASHLSEGQPAPAFDLPRDGGGRLALSDFAGRKLVLFFYPRANTPGCTREAMDFSRLAPAFAASGAGVIGLSADTVKSQDSFRDKHGLTVPLVSDEPKATLAAYGAWGEKSLYGKTFLGVIRTTVLIDAKGRIARIWRNVKVDGHADAVLAACREL
ncbi:MAG: peroxiredoxin [Xanthobacteraceae bacterium]|nr:peroxiredoxin [Xanthobacteraceae bacterium]